jgi:hypothetical protein
MDTLARAARASLSLALFAALALPAAHGLAAQSNEGGDVLTTVYGNLPTMTDMVEGPRIEGIISARQGPRLQVTADDGTSTILTLHPETEIRTRGGFLGIGNKTFDQSALINGLPVKVRTRQYGDDPWRYSSEICRAGRRNPAERRCHRSATRPPWRHR